MIAEFVLEEARLLVLLELYVGVNRRNQNDALQFVQDRPLATRPCIRVDRDRSQEGPHQSPST